MLVQCQGEEIGHNLLHIFCKDLSADSESEKILPIGKLMAQLLSFENVINSAFFHYNSGKKGASEMILTFLNFFRRGLPTDKKSAC
jgi:hypothetical protein